MSHYLTQPEEIDYILMTEDDDLEADITVSAGAQCEYSECNQR